ncbi:MAG TPA: sugar ABC transporter permease [Jiangellaceae bacterium]|nr:sugar ABC transporter permease [Jiangellaceae bacterium]
MATTAAARSVALAEARPPGAGGGRPPGEPRRVAYLYILPAYLVFVLFLLIPLGRAVVLSLYDWNGLTVAEWVGLDNYREVVADEGLRAAFGHAAVLIVFYAVLPVLVALALVATMTRARLRGLGFYRTVLFVPQVVAMVVVAVAWRQIYAPDGPLNQVLRAVGLDGLARAWLGDFTFALPAVGFVGTWVQMGLCIVLFLAGVSKIPRELYEAARLDGAGPVREFFTVVLPALRNEISVALTLTVVAALRNFDLVYVTTRGGPGTSTTVPSYEVYRRAFEIGEVGSAAAVAVTLTAMIFVLTFGITRIAERGSA